VTEALDIHESDMRLMKIAIHEAQKSLSEGGVPVGAALARGDKLLASGHNERVQRGDPIAHGEIACLRNAGRQESYGDTTLYTTLSPCEMCSGAILLFKIPRVVVGQATTFRGNLDRLRRHGVKVILLDDDNCVQLMRSFQQQYPHIWLEDIGEASPGPR
jgi:creatinine deaminase